MSLNLSRYRLPGAGARCQIEVTVGVLEGNADNGVLLDAEGLPAEMEWGFQI